MASDITRTLLLTNFSKSKSHQDLLSICQKAGEVKEHFTMHNKYSVLFVVFYDLQAAVRAKEELSSLDSSIVIKFSIARCEIPKGSDACTEEKNQGSVSYLGTTEYMPDNPQEISKQTKKGNETVLLFHDSRCALKFLQYLKTSHPRAGAKLCWDNDLRKRRNLLLEAEEVVKNAPPGFTKPSPEEPSKRSFPGHDREPETRKRAKSTSNWMLALFDKYIIDNAAKVAENIQW
ncbi:hypothetical protein NEHOM01_1272 [Nematocida homosporus]|uniref:uncharacterized protein n=1 Tax=Nematocida homosporus TaxID=1912981 RepID=UPI00221FEE02|nr:uncharacterized protein NEHOM01_1272 [Nematocida homosporus]KAI5186090.1 hypothetical protein NEHOM01_1272 [Nematocida homosporus]